MARVRVVTDSTARLDRRTIERLGITVLPLRVHLDGETFREGVDITPTEFFHKLARSSSPPTTSPPPVEEFVRAYRRLHATTDQILSLHVSSKLSDTYANALAASEAFLGRCQITVMDSQTISLGLGILVKAAAEAAAAGQSIDDIVRLIRGMVPHIYVVFFVETLDYLERGGRIGKAQAILGTMLEIKPFLTIEEGEIIPLEKVRDQDKLVDKLFEFVIEFSEIEQAAILQSTPHPLEETKLLLERLEIAFPEVKFPIMVYGPTLATLIGPDGLGIVIYEGMSPLE